MNATNPNITNTMNGNNQEQLISMKVMRLARPRFSSSYVACLDPIDEMSLRIDKSFQYDNQYHLPINDFLLAPTQFDNIYLGETFSFLINCANECIDRVHEVSVKVELQTASQRIQLPSTLNLEVMEGHASVADILSHEVKEIGQHILVCSVTYKTNTGENMFMRKFFKFPVTKPIDVKTKLYNTEENASFDIFLEAQIENASSLGMQLERVSMEASQSYISTPIAPLNQSIYLHPGDVLQVVFGLIARSSANPKEITKIGRLDMEWKTRMGERGRLQTSDLDRILPGYGDLRLKMERLPSSVSSREVFQIECSLHNCCDHSLDLRLRFDSSVQPSIVFCSPSGIPLGQIPPRSSTTFNLSILAVSIGFQSISGIRVEDSFAKRVYEFDDIAQIFVI